jgi:hypothetical protein
VGDVQGEKLTSGGAVPSSATSAEPEDGLAVHGSLTTRYVGRQRGGEQDHDLYALLSLDVGDRIEDEWTAYVLGRVSKDLDGDTGGEDSTFFSQEDTYSGSLNGRLYEAYVENHDSGLEVLRLGRQTLYETPEFVRIDGVRLETASEGGDKHSFGAYVGRPVHEYESSPSGDEASALDWSAYALRAGTQHGGLATGHQTVASFALGRLAEQVANSPAAGEILGAYVREASPLVDEPMRRRAAAAVAADGTQAQLVRLAADLAPSDDARLLRSALIALESNPRAEAVRPLYEPLRERLPLGALADARPAPSEDDG